MQIEILSDDYYAKRELRRCVTAARRRFEAHRPAGQLPLTFKLSVRVVPRIRRAKFDRGGFKGTHLRLPRKGLTRGELTRVIAWGLMRYIFPGADQRKYAIAAWQDLSGESPVFQEAPVLLKAKPKVDRSIDARYQKCLAAVGRAKARVVTLEKQLARAQVHLSKTEKEAQKHARNLTRTIEPGEKLSNAYLSARLRLNREDESAEHEQPTS